MSNYYCLNCGSLVPAGKKFCPVCGDRIVGNNTLQTAELSFPANPEAEKTFNYVPVDDPKQVGVSPTQENAKTIAVDRPQPKQEAPKKEKKQSFLSSIFFEEVEVDEDENTKQPKEKHHSILPAILLILLAVLVGAFGFLYFEKPALLNQGLNSIGLGLPGYTQKAAVTTATASPSISATATASASATATPAATPTSTTLGTLTVNIESINIRDAASTTGNAVGKATSGKIYTVLATKSGEGYTWYEIEKDQWVADGGGDWVTYTAK